MRSANRVFFSLVLVLAALILLAGCNGGCPTTGFGSTGTGNGGSKGISGSVCGSGSGGPGGTTSAFLYYLGTDNIQGAGLSTTGTFTGLTGFTPPTLPSSAGNDMVIVNKTFLYLPQNDSLTIQAFAIAASTGALTAIPGSPFATSSADSIASDPAGRFLFVGNDTTGTIDVFTIDATTGALALVPGSPFLAFNLDFVHTLAVDGGGKFLYASQGKSFLSIYVFLIDQNTGALSAAGSFALGVAGVRADFSGNFVIGLTGNTGDNNLYVFAIDPTTGAPAAVANSPFPTTNTPYNLRIHPTSQFVYSFGVDSNGAIAALEGFQLDATTGALTALTGSPFSSLPIEGDCKWDEGGSAAFCANATSTAFSVLTTDITTGALTNTVPDLTVTNSFVAFAPTD